MIVQIHKQGQLTHDGLAGLMFGYRPLIGHQAVEIYQGLYALCPIDQPIDERVLAGLLQMTLSQWEAGRKLLEQFGLLRTARLTEPDKEAENTEMASDSLILRLIEPLNLKAFMSHELYGRFLLQALGKERMEQLRALCIEPLWPENAQEITEPIDVDVLEDRWNPGLEEYFKSHRVYLHEPDRYNFDWAIFFKGADRIFPQRLRTRENLSRIAALANAYGIGEVDMRHKMHRFIKDNKTVIDFDGLAESLSHSKKVLTRDPSDYTQSPVSFLQARSPQGVSVLADEKKTLLDIQEKAGFSNEVINTIVEYSMEECQGDFVDKYIQKVAQNAKRNKVETRDQLLEYFSRHSAAVNKKKHRTEGHLPDWYSDIPTEKASQEDVDNALAVLDKIMGDGNK